MGNEELRMWNRLWSDAPCITGGDITNLISKDKVVFVGNFAISEISTDKAPRGPYVKYEFVGPPGAIELFLPAMDSKKFVDIANGRYDDDGMYGGESGFDDLVMHPAIGLSRLLALKGYYLSSARFVDNDQTYKFGKDEIMVRKFVGHGDLWIPKNR